MIPSVERFGPTSYRLFMDGGRVLYYSYATCVAVKTPEEQIRRERHYSRTTAKHMGIMGVAKWRKVPDAEFERIAGGQ